MKKTRIIVLDAMLIAMYTVLSLFDIKIGNFFKFSIATLPVIVGGLMLGPAHGFIIGFIGCFINQMMTYGWMATTMLYVIPYAFCGLTAGLLGALFRYDYTRTPLEWKMFGRQFSVDRSMIRVVLTSLATTTVLTLLNTVALYIASHMEGWYSPKVVFGSLVSKFLKNIFLSVAYMILLPPILREAAKFMKTSGKEEA